MLMLWMKQRAIDVHRIRAFPGHKSEQLLWHCMLPCRQDSCASTSRQQSIDHDPIASKIHPQSYPVRAIERDRANSTDDHRESRPAPRLIPNKCCIQNENRGCCYCCCGCLEICGPMLLLLLLKTMPCCCCMSWIRSNPFKLQTVSLVSREMFARVFQQIDAVEYWLLKHQTYAPSSGYLVPYIFTVQVPEYPVLLLGAGSNLYMVRGTSTSTMILFTVHPGARGIQVVRQIRRTLYMHMTYCMHNAYCIQIILPVEGNPCTSVYVLPPTTTVVIEPIKHSKKLDSTN